MNKKKLILRYAEITDFPFFFRIKSEGKNMKWTGHSHKPNKEKLCIWYNENLHSASRKILILTVNNIPVGYAYVDNPGNYFETSVAVSEDYEGRGFGKKIVSETVKFIRDYSMKKPIFAWILDKNIASVKIHEQVGYIKTKDTKDFQFDNEVIEKMTRYQLIP